MIMAPWAGQSPVFTSTGRTFPCRSQTMRQLAPACALALAASAAFASSHREAPFITAMPKVDATDFYMFRSYETGRARTS